MTQSFIFKFGEWITPDEYHKFHIQTITREVTNNMENTQQSIPEKEVDVGKGDEVAKVDSKVDQGVPGVNPSDIGPGESEGVDLEKYDKKEVKIASAKPIMVPSTYTDCGTQWVLQVQSDVLETYDSKDDAGNTKTTEFRASALFNLIQNDKGELLRFPTGDTAKLVKFLKDLKVDVSTLKNLQDVINVIIGKTTLIKSYEKDKDGKSRTYLTFRY